MQVLVSYPCYLEEEAAQVSAEAIETVCSLLVLRVPDGRLLILALGEARLGLANLDNATVKEGWRKKCEPSEPQRQEAPLNSSGKSLYVVLFGLFTAALEIHSSRQPRTDLVAPVDAHSPDPELDGPPQLLAPPHRSALRQSLLEISMQRLGSLMEALGCLASESSCLPGSWEARKVPLRREGALELRDRPGHAARELG